MNRDPVSRKRIEAFVLLTLSCGAQASDSQSAAEAAYGRAIHDEIHRNWTPDVRDARTKPGAQCSVRIIQMPGGHVVDAQVLPGCEFGEDAALAAVSAIHRSDPLPYLGHEDAYRREIHFLFRAPTAVEREAMLAAEAEQKQIIAASAASDREWHATVGADRKRGEYIRACSFNVLWGMPRIELSRPVAVTITVDLAGKVVRTGDENGNPLEAVLDAALRAVPSCEPVPSSVASGRQTLTFGPLTVSPRSN